MKDKIKARRNARLKWKNLERKSSFLPASQSFTFQHHHHLVSAPLLCNLQSINKTMAFSSFHFFSSSFHHRLLFCFSFICFLSFHFPSFSLLFKFLQVPSQFFPRSLWCGHHDSPDSICVLWRESFCHQGPLWPPQEAPRDRAGLFNSTVWALNAAEGLLWITLVEYHPGKEETKEVFNALQERFSQRVFFASILQQFSFSFFLLSFFISSFISSFIHFFFHFFRSSSFIVSSCSLSFLFYLSFHISFFSCRKKWFKTW